MSRSGVASPELGSEAPRSMVHRLVQSIVLNIFLLLHFLLPYIIVMLKSAASVERKYKISEAIVGRSRDCFTAAGRSCAHVAEVAFKTNDGRVGQGVSTIFMWTVEEVTRGISDGIGEGLLVTRLKEPS